MAKEMQGALAAKHALVYGTLKKNWPLMPVVDGVELTNICNLSCPNCPTPTTQYPRGYATEQTVTLAMRYAAPDSLFSFHRLGEPFLHKSFLHYLRLAGETGLRAVVSTNGTLLNTARMEEMLDARPWSVMVSLHTRKSLEAFARLAEHCFAHNAFPPKFCANLLSHNREDVFAWADDMQLDVRIRDLFRDVQSHSWAGNVAARKTVYDDAHRQEMVRRCFFIRFNHVNIRWDGSVVACCLDSENITQLGHVHDLPKIRQNPAGYALCRTCDRDWMHD